ncbi:MULTISPECIES: FUSC family protein [Pseudomonas]|uniref:FUSC family protein n=1 Tax=Pseudomonas TaxID=286 RepID=UPI000C87E09F|nr:MULTISPECIES: FUSC family protein [Pseudomonas]AWA37205.1 FUSC family protein [Pseudomonas fluorescens]NKF25979.1 FUSC family protein [Pseudomonas sp. BG5]PNB78555.1 fusaric acid resistance protein [Pseudomonas sp. FW305-BF6]PNA03880.1 fusaric acid resistance protein [Pseudomonas sp. FW305-BF15]PNB48964.1 fusaric acid resistance protein [Pseudomonas sp. GW456-12-10-14-LB2]
MNGFFSGMPPARDWFYGIRTFAASMTALYIALLMQMPRPYWAMATVYIVSSPFLGPTSSKALYRAIGTFLGAAAAVLFVPMFVQSPYVLVVVIALWTGILLFLSLHLRTANNYALMLAGYTLPLIALPVVDNPLAVWDVAESRTEEIFLGIAVAAVVGAMFWPRRLAPVFNDAVGKWFADATTYSLKFLSRDVQPEEVAALRMAMVGSFNSLELMIGQLPHEGARPQTVRNTKELRGRMIHLLPVIDALEDSLYALERRTPELVEKFAPLLTATREWLGHKDADLERWQALRDQLEALQPSAEALEDRKQLLFSNALYRLGEFIDLWQDCRSLQDAILCERQDSWRAVYRHWRLGRLTPFIDRGLMLYSVASTILAIIVASVLWILLGWTDGGSAVILAAVSCSFFASMDDPAPQIYRFFFWTGMSVLFASLYLFLVLPNLHDFPMLVLAFAVPFICVGTLTVQPRFYLGMLLTLVNTSSFISISGAYDADFFAFVNSNLAGPIGLLFAFIWTLIARPFGAELAAKRLTRFSWKDIVSMTEPANLAEHRQLGVQLLDRLMQHLPRLALTGQDTGIAMREVRVGLNLLDLLAYTPRVTGAPNALLKQVVAEVGEYFRACLKAGERLPAPSALLMTMDRTRRALNGHGDEETRLNLLHALSGLRLALLPGVEFVSNAEPEEPLPEGAPL